VAGDARATIVRFTPRGRRLLDTVLTLVDEIESGFEGLVGPEPFGHLRGALISIADTTAPHRSLGPIDE
jgi:DNA-binding transcriptional LysR family regulator